MCEQATLAVLMQRLASEHPHHTLHCLLALKNGNCGRDGRRADAPGRTSRDALVHSVDFDKVAAAEDVLNAVAKKPTLCAQLLAYLPPLASQSDASALPGDGSIDI